MHYNSDQTAERNRHQKIGDNDIDNYFDSENLDYELQQPGEKCRCGTERTGADKGSDYILGGRTVQANKYPWVVLLKVLDHRGYLTCGGTLVASKYILTAAHCVHGHQGTRVKESDIKVRMFAMKNNAVFSTLIGRGMSRLGSH